LRLILSGVSGQGQMKPEQAEIARLKRGVTKLKAERDILKKPRPGSRRNRREIILHREAPGMAADWLCGVLGISRGGYAWLTRSRSQLSRKAGSYVAVVVDLFSRHVVGWSMNPAMTA